MQPTHWIKFGRLTNSFHVPQVVCELVHQSIVLVSTRPLMLESTVFRKAHVEDQLLTTQVSTFSCPRYGKPIHQ